MPSVRRLRGVACPTCHATWPRRSARFCGRCGEPLRPAGSHATDPGSDPTGPTMAIAAVAAAALVVAAVAVGTTVSLGPSDGEPSTSTDGDDVALPDPAELQPSPEPETPAEPVPPARAPTDPVVRDLARVTCVDGPCTRWSTPLPPGRAVDLDRFLLHVERKVGPPTDWPDEGREEPSRDYAVLTAVAPSDGTVLWDAELRLPQLTDRDVQALPAADLIVLAWDHKVVAVDAGTGDRRWTSHLGSGVHLVHVGGDGDVLVWWADVAGDDEVARSPEPGDGTIANVPGTLASLDLADGGLRWRTDASPVLVTGTRLVSLSHDTGVLHGIDLQDGRNTWSRELSWLTEAPLIPITDDQALARTERGLQILDLETGETLQEQPAASSLTVTVIGTTVIVHPPEVRPREGRRPRAAPTSIRVHDLSDPDGVATQIDGVVAVRPLVDRTHALHGSWQQLAAAGAAIVRQQEAAVEVTLLGFDGQVRLDAEPALMSDRCCWRLLPGSDLDGLVLLDPDAMTDRVVALSTADLTGRAEVDLPRTMVVTDVVRTDPLLLTVQGGEGVGRGLWLASPDGLVGLLGLTEVVRTGPQPVVMTADGLIGLDLG